MPVQGRRITGVFCDGRNRLLIRPNMVFSQKSRGKGKGESERIPTKVLTEWFFRFGA